MKGARGFALIEILVAMFLTVYAMYDVSTGAFAAAEAGLRYL